MVTNLLKVQKKVDNFSQTFFFLKVIIKQINKRKIEV